MPYKKKGRREIKPAQTELALALHGLMVKNGWSYREVGEQVSTSHTTVAGWVRTGARPEPESWQDIADFLGWPLERVEKALGYQGAESTQPGAELTAEERELLAWYRGTDERGKGDIRRVAQASFEWIARQPESSEEPQHRRAG